MKTYQTRADLVSQDSINNYLRQFEKFGIKTTGSLGNTSTLDWIKKSICHTDICMNKSWKILSTRGSARIPALNSHLYHNELYISLLISEN